MTLPRARLALLAATLLAASALAASPDLRAERVALEGSLAVEGDAHALLLVADLAEFSWDVTAASAHLVREHADIPAGVLNPLNPDAYLYAAQGDWQVDEEDFGPLALTPRGMPVGAALLARASAATVEAASSHGAAISWARDPILSQGPPPESENDAGDRGEIAERVPGEYLLVAMDDGSFTLRGDITITLYGPAYLRETAQDAVEERTGEFETRAAGPVVQARQERHTYVLRDAVLTAHAPGGATLLTRFPVVEVDGALEASGARGALQLGDAPIAPSADGRLRWEGSGTLELSPSQGLVQLATPAVATSGATVSAAPSVLTLTAAGVAALALAAGAVAFAYRRRMRADDLELALLAMEERRWQDALPRLARVARARPHDAGVLVDRALCYEQLGRLAEAARAFEGALRASPRHAEAHFYYARTLAKMRETDAARAHLEAALEHDPRLVEMARRESVLRGL